MLERRRALEVFLGYPDVPIDPNHLERALRAIPMGHRNWLFAWTEAGARELAIIPSLVVKCRLQGINAYIYLVVGPAAHSDRSEQPNRGTHPSVLERALGR